VVSSLSKPTSGSSGPSAQPPEGAEETDPKKSRIQRTAENVINYFKKLKQEGLEFLGRNGEKRAYINRQTKEIRYNDDTHNEIECFDSSRRHSVRDPITNQLLDKPQHQFPNWLKRLL
jgi:hypothetical protein